MKIQSILATNYIFHDSDFVTDFACVLILFDYFHSSIFLSESHKTWITWILERMHKYSLPHILLYLSFALSLNNYFNSSHFLCISIPTCLLVLSLSFFSFFFYFLCTIMALNDFLSLVSLTNVCIFAKIHAFCFAIHTNKHVSSMPSSVLFVLGVSNSPSHFSCLFLPLFISVRFFSWYRTKVSNLTGILHFTLEYKCSFSERNTHNCKLTIEEILWKICFVKSITVKMQAYSLYIIASFRIT